MELFTLEFAFAVLGVFSFFLMGIIGRLHYKLSCLKSEKKDKERKKDMDVPSDREQIDDFVRNQINNKFKEIKGYLYENCDKIIIEETISISPSIFLINELRIECLSVFYHDNHIELGDLAIFFKDREVLLFKDQKKALFKRAEELYELKQRISKKNGRKK